jgi:excisionase family DNA binding protein
MAAPPVRDRKRGPKSDATVSPKPKREERPAKAKKVEGLPDDSMLTCREVADALGISIRLLADWRYHDRHLRYYTVGGKVRYRLDDVRRFMERSLHDDVDEEITPRQRDAVRRHLAGVIAQIRADGLTSAEDIAAFIRAGGIRAVSDAEDAAERAAEDRLDG